MKMIGKLNEKDLKINKKQMILWMGGILAAVILLMVFIVKVEPPAEGISRAEAAKALALVFEDPQTLEDMASERENSSFTDKEKGNWFVKYMDYLYEKDRIKEMFHRHDIHHPVKYGAVLYFQGRQLQIADQTAACELAKEKCVVKPWIFYKEGEHVIEYGPNPYLALYYIETENRRQLEMETEKFFSEMSIRDPEGREVAYRNKIPEYEKEKKTDD